MRAVRSNRRLAAAVAVFTVILSGLVAPTAHAASAGTITASVASGAVVLSPSTMTANAGDTFDVVNLHSSTLTLSDGTAVVENAPGYDCYGGCPIYYTGSGQSNISTFTVVTAGTVTIQANQVTAATLTIAPGSGNAAAAQYTMTFDGTGATSCTPARATGASTAAYSLPSAANCVRPGYTLLGWSHSKTATAPDDANLTQGPDPAKAPQASFADNGTLYAVWQPVASTLEVTYDANVGASDECWTPSGANVPGGHWEGGADESKRFIVDPEARRTRASLDVNAPTPTTAFCKPPYAVLAGWSTSPKDAMPAWSLGTLKGTYIALGASVKSAFTTTAVPSALTLYAVWTLPTVKLMSAPLIAGTGTKSQVDWGSRITVSSTPSSMMMPVMCGSNPTTGVPATALYGSGPEWMTDMAAPWRDGRGYFFEAFDLLGNPAAHTRLIVLAPSTMSGQSASIGFFGPGPAGPYGTTGPWTMAPAGGFATVVTDKRGSTVSDGALVPSDTYTFPLAFPMFACPVKAGTAGEVLGGLGVLTNNPFVPLTWLAPQVYLVRN